MRALKAPLARACKRAAESVEPPFDSDSSVASSSKGDERGEDSPHPHAMPLLVDVLSVKEHPRTTLLANAPAGASILCTHPMFGPESGRLGWAALPLVYDRVRLFDAHTDVCERFLSIFEQRGCKVRGGSVLHKEWLP